MLTLLKKIKAFEAKNRKKGSAMLLVMMTMSVIMVIGTSMLFVSLSSYSRSLADTNQQKVQAAATSVADNIRENLATIMPLYNTVIGNATEEEPLYMTFSDNSDELLVNGTKVKIAMFKKANTPSSYTVKVTAKRNGQEYSIKFGTTSTSNVGYTYIDQAYGNAFVMTNNLGDVGDDFNTIVKRVEGDISIDVPEGTTKYINAKVVEGISGSVFADGDLVIGSVWNIIQIQGNIYVNGNLTLRGVQTGVLLPSIYEEEMGTMMQHTDADGNTLCYKTYLIGSDNAVSEFLDFGTRTELDATNNGEAMYNYDGTPMQVYSEGCRPVIKINGEDVIGYYNASGDLRTVDEDDGGSTPVTGEIMYKTATDQSTSNQAPRYPIGGNIYCTGNLIIDKANQGCATYGKINVDGGTSGANLKYKRDINNEVIENQSIINGDIFVQGKFIYAPDNVGVSTHAAGVSYSNSAMTVADATASNFSIVEAAESLATYMKNKSPYSGFYSSRGADVAIAKWERFKNVKSDATFKYRTGGTWFFGMNWHDIEYTEYEFPSIISKNWDDFTDQDGYYHVKDEYKETLTEFENRCKTAFSVAYKALSKDNIASSLLPVNATLVKHNGTRLNLTGIIKQYDPELYTEIKFSENTHIYVNNSSTIYRYGREDTTSNANGVYTLKYATKLADGQHSATTMVLGGDGVSHEVEATYNVEDIKAGMVVKFHTDFKCAGVYVNGPISIVSSTVDVGTKQYWLFGWRDYTLDDWDTNYTIDTKISTYGTGTEGINATAVNYACYDLTDATYNFTDAELEQAYAKLNGLSTLLVQFIIEDTYYSGDGSEAEQSGGIKGRLWAPEDKLFNVKSDSAKLIIGTDKYEAIEFAHSGDDYFYGNWSTYATDGNGIVTTEYYNNLKKYTLVSSIYGNDANKYINDKSNRPTKWDLGDGVKVDLENDGSFKIISLNDFKKAMKTDGKAVGIYVNSADVGLSHNDTSTATNLHDWSSAVAYGIVDADKSRVSESTVNTNYASASAVVPIGTTLGPEYSLYLHNESREITGTADIDTVGEVFAEMVKPNHDMPNETTYIYEFAKVTVASPNKVVSNAGTGEGSGAGGNGSGSGSGTGSTNTTTSNIIALNKLVESGQVTEYTNMVTGTPYKLIQASNSFTDSPALTNVDNGYALVEKSGTNEHIQVMGFINEAGEYLTADDVKMAQNEDGTWSMTATQGCYSEDLKSGKFVDPDAVQNGLTGLGGSDDSTQLRSQVVYTINKNVYFNLMDNANFFDNESRRYSVTFGSTPTGTFGNDFASALRTRRTVFNIDTSDQDIYLYFYADQFSFLKTTFQVTGSHDAYIVMVGNTDLNFNAFTYSIELGSLDKTDARLGSYLLSLTYAPYSSPVYTHDGTSQGVTVTKGEIQNVGKLFVIGTSDNDEEGEGNVLTIGRGGCVNAFVYMPNGTYTNESKGILGFIPTASSQNNKSSIVAKYINVNGSNSGKMIFAAYDPANSGFSGANIIFTQVEGITLGTDANSTWKFDGYEF